MLVDDTPGDKMKQLLGYLKKVNQEISKLQGRPFFEALRFFIIYLLVGIVWIVWSDKWLAAVVSDYDTFIEMQTYKGWFYVITSGLLFFFILKSRLALLKDLSDKLIHQATYDDLTQLPNKSKLTQMIDLKIGHSESNDQYALICMDFDDFSNVNELLGYHIGDQLISSVSMRVKSLINEEDIIGRDSDGFVFFINLNKYPEDQLIDFLEEIKKSVNQSLNIENQILFMTCTMGVSRYPQDGHTFVELYKAANAAIHQLKEKGKNDYHFFAQEYHLKRLERVTMMNELRKSIEQRDLHFVYQPIYQMIENKIIGFETLIRWISPTFGPVSPAIFIEYSENTGLIQLIDEFVFESVIQLRKEWCQSEYKNIMISLNLSAKGLASAQLMTKVASLIQLHKIDPKYIQIEITETALIANFDIAIEHLKFLRSLGFSIALDDFGSGYSSLTYLQTLPIDTLKIDRTFTKNIGLDVKQDMILEAIINLADELDLKLVIEGIENVQQRDFLLEHQCLFGQGYFFGQPLELTKACDLVNKDLKEANIKSFSDVI
jgi:diguanylate cyclase (GGDEF)-like protein